MPKPPLVGVLTVRGGDVAALAVMTSACREIVVEIARRNGIPEKEWVEACMEELHTYSRIIKEGRDDALVTLGALYGAAEAILTLFADRYQAEDAAP